MKLPRFEYHLAESVDEAVGLLAELGDDAKVLAGGQSLVPLLSLRLARPAHVIDINGIAELSHITNGGGGDGLELGATVRHRDAERSGAVRASGPLLAGALRFVGHTAIRTRGTIGGSIAHADPAAELPTVLAALDGEVVARSSHGSRSVPAGALFDGFLTTTLHPDELLTAVRLPAWPGAGWSFQEFSRRSGDFAVVGVAAVVGVGRDGRINHARLALCGVGGTPVRASKAEQAMMGEAPSAELWTDAAQEAANDLDPPGDLHGTPAYRRQLARVLGARALQEAHERAEGTR